MIEVMVQQKYGNNSKVKLVNYNKKTTISEYFSSFTEYGTQSKYKLSDFIPTSMILSRRPLYLWE